MHQVPDWSLKTQAFTFLPALAGSAETGAKGVANEQVVDIPNGRVVNNVDVDLPWPIGGARVGVEARVGVGVGAGRTGRGALDAKEFSLL